MKNFYKNLISFIISTVFIITGIFLVYKTSGNVINYLIDDFKNKNESMEYNENIKDNDNHIIINSDDTMSYESKDITIPDSIDKETKETTAIDNDNIENNENENKKITNLKFVETSSKSNAASVYRRTYIDPINPDIMHVIDGNYDKTFFKNSLFIGDSRVDGLKLYANVPDAHYFCSTGLTEYTLFKEPLVVANVGNIYLEFLIATNKYDKIFFQMGINSLGTKFQNHVKEFGNAINKIHELSPNSKIYIVSNMHVIKKRSDESKYITNANIDLFNKAIMDFADNKNIFYIDINEFLDDETTGVLNEEYTRDGVHLLPKYYDIEMDVFYNYSR